MSPPTWSSQTGSGRRGFRLRRYPEGIATASHSGAGEHVSHAAVRDSGRALSTAAPQEPDDDERQADEGDTAREWGQKRSPLYGSL